MFSSFLFLAKIGRKNDCGDVLGKEVGFLDYEKID